MNKPHSKQNELHSIADDLDQLVDTPGFDEAIEHDFGGATEGMDMDDGVSRRRWLQLMGASLALGGAAGCRYEEEKIVPFAFRPQGRIPGMPENFASMIDFAGVAQPLLSTNYDGRPIKLDGNPKHPSSMGASSAFTQATILEFYDPDRLRAPLKVDPTEKLATRAFTETTADEMMDVLVEASKNCDSLAVLAEPTSSPSMLRMQKALEAKGAKWFTFASVNDDNARAGAKKAFGKVVRPHYDFEKATVIVTLDADIMGTDPAAIANSLSFSRGRNADSGNMSRLYTVESQFSTTGAAADHRISCRSCDIAGFIASLEKAIKATTFDQEVDKSLGYRDKVLAAMAQDLVDARGAGVIVVGDRQPAEVHAMAHHLNDFLQNIGRAVSYSDVADADRKGSLESIQEFVSSAGSFKTLVVLGGNPVYTAAGIEGVEEAIRGIENVIHVSSYKNETSACCNWVTAVAHPLEVWKDGIAVNGSICVGQPLINPLFNGMSDIETISVIATGAMVGGMDIVKETVGLSANDWTKAVHDGFVQGSAAKPVTVSATEAPGIPATDAWKGEWDGKLEVVFAPSRSVYDGRYANNAWLQELPDFISKHTWDGILSVSPKTAEALGLKQSTKATVALPGGEVRLPVHVQPGQANGSIGLALGYGRTLAGRVGGDVGNRVKPVGADVGKLRTADTWNFAGGLETSIVTGSGTRYKLALIQEPWTIDEKGRGEIQNRMFRNKDKNESDRSRLIREGSLASYQEFLKAHPIEENDHDHDDHDHDHDDKKEAAMLPKATSLPIITNVSFNPGGGVPVTPVREEKKEDGHEGEDHEHGDDHGHGHGDHHQWPEAFHMHHELFDLTKGSREDYSVENGHENVWGKSIDLNKCIGCNACVTACQAENNVPVVGREEVWRGREMHWIRIDRYYGDNLYNKEAAESDDKVIVHQPVACHHCENAPCETVCPVAATVHSREGLNDMVYNRCIGTRYCGNNCPYKVRRFNFFNYSDAKTFLKYPGADKLPSGDRNLQNLMMNPEVTIRTRGVMEKCSYCVQRIQSVKIKAKADGNRKIGPNEITTACQDACPTKAIEFGDLNNKESRVAKAHANPRAYSMLEILNNRPRTKYLARVANPHPALRDHDDRDSVSPLGH
jgi:molybdopterin-containing oxidoreductase family iron-sulfur binding subunit